MNDTTPPNISQELLHYYYDQMVDSSEAMRIFDSRLAKTFGMFEAVFLALLGKLCKQSSKGGKIIDGKRWVYNTYQTWHDNYFEWVSPQAIQRVVLKLEKDGYIESCQPDGFDKKKYYRPNKDNIMTALVENYPDQFPNLIRNRLIDGIKSNTMEGIKSDTFINSNNSSNTLTLSKDKVTPSIEKEKKPRERNLMFDMIAAITVSDITVKSNASSVAKAARELSAAGYTPEDIEAFSKWWARNKKGFGKPPKPYQIAPDIKLALAGNVYDYTTLIKLPESEEEKSDVKWNADGTWHFEEPEDIEKYYDDDGTLLPF